MKSKNLAAGMLLLAASFCAGAQSMKPGLWEISSIVQADGGTMAQEMAQMQKELADMPPEQRKMMQDMMAKQGVSIGTGGVAAPIILPDIGLANACFIGFMGVNLAALKRGATIPAKLMAAAGFLICGFLWWNLSTQSKLYGAAWLSVGLIWHFWEVKRRGRLQ